MLSKANYMRSESLAVISDECISDECISDECISLQTTEEADSSTTASKPKSDKKPLRSEGMYVT